MREAQKLLLEKAKESLRAAELLSNETMYGFAASRAYYSMFYVAQAFLIEESLSFSSHAAVISSFGKTFAKTKRLPTKFHRYLIDAAQTRTDGDYNTATTVTAGEAFESIAHAKEFIAVADDEL
ncbi:MAG: HEPN domain-containing protein [Cyanobacteria bacterium P01_D01_bin.36]